MSKKRIASVELMRIIACFLVVGLHAIEEIIDKTGSIFSETYFLTFFFDGVTVFWMITGFFIFNNEYKSLIERTFKKIWLPVTVISIICVVAYDYYLLINSGQQMQSVFSYIVYLINNILRFRTFAPSCAHFWFIYVYCLVVIFYPILKSFVKYLDESVERQKIFVLITLILIIINEITLNNFLSINNHGLSAMIMASIEIIYGHIIYINKDKFIEKSSIIKCLLSICLIELVRCVVYMLLQKNGLPIRAISSWFSIFGVIVSLALVLLCFNLVDENRETKLIIVVGKLTFYVYLLHKIPIKILRKLGIEAYIVSQNGIMKIVFAILYCFICFIITIVISFILAKIKDTIIKKQKKIS